MNEKSLWTASDPLVLASKSAIRKTLLDQAGLLPEIIVPDFDERHFEHIHQLAPQERAQRLADEKALAVSRLYPKAWVIGADQTLETDGVIFSKPADRHIAAQHLSRLQGQTHVLRSGVAVARGNETVFRVAPEARLTMRVLSAKEIETYLDLAVPDCLSSVGAYQVESLGQHLFDRIEGLHSVVLGLPMEDLLRFFRSRSCLAL